MSASNCPRCDHFPLIRPYYDRDIFLCEKCVTEFFKCNKCKELISKNIYGLSIAPILCQSCGNRFHPSCVDQRLYVSSRDNDGYYFYKCEECSK